MEDIVTFCEGACRKGCHFRVPAEESDEEVTSCGRGSKARRYRKRGLQTPSNVDAKTAMETTPSPVRRMLSAPLDSEGYHTCYPLDGARAEPSWRGDRIPPPTLNLLMRRTGIVTAKGGHN